MQESEFLKSGTFTCIVKIEGSYAHHCLTNRMVAWQRKNWELEEGLWGVDRVVCVVQITLAWSPLISVPLAWGRQQQKPGIEVRWGIDGAGLHKPGKTRAGGLSLPRSISFVCVYGLIRFGPVRRQVPRLRKSLYLLPCCEVLCSYIDSPYCFPSGTLVIFFFYSQVFLSVRTICSLLTAPFLVITLL